jgi:hypothetical protein
MGARPPFESLGVLEQAVPSNPACIIPLLLMSSNVSTEDPRRFSQTNLLTSGLEGKGILDRRATSGAQYPSLQSYHDQKRMISRPKT